LKEAEPNAFNDSIQLNKIKIGLSDEIFQAGDPVAWWMAYTEKKKSKD
jgi:hypothetical protein